MIMGHSSISEKTGYFIGSFHMPLFFIMAGYFLKFNDGAADFIRKKARRLLLPYIACTTVIAIADLSINFILKRSDSLINEIANWFYRISYANSHSNHNLFGIAGISVFWFLIALFNASVILYIIMKNIKKPLVVVIIVSIIGVMLYKYMSFELPFSINASLVAVIYLYIGYCAKKHINLIQKYKGLLIIFSIAVWTIDLLLYSDNTMIDLAVGRVDSLLCFIGSISASFLFVQFSKLIENMRNIPHVFQYIGKNSLLVLCVHGFDCFICPASYLSHILGVLGFNTCLLNIDIISKIMVALLGTIVVSQFSIARKLFEIE